MTPKPVPWFALAGIVLATVGPIIWWVLRFRRKEEGKGRADRLRRVETVVLGVERAPPGEPEAPGLSVLEEVHLSWGGYRTGRGGTAIILRATLRSLRTGDILDRVKVADDQGPGWRYVDDRLVILSFHVMGVADAFAWCGGIRQGLHLRDARTFRLVETQAQVLRRNGVDEMAPWPMARAEFDADSGSVDVLDIRGQQVRLRVPGGGRFTASGPARMAPGAVPGTSLPPRDDGTVVDAEGPAGEGCETAPPGEVPDRDWAMPRRVACGTLPTGTSLFVHRPRLDARSDSLSLVDQRGIRWTSDLARLWSADDIVRQTGSYLVLAWALHAPELVVLDLDCGRTLWRTRA